MYLISAGLCESFTASIKVSPMDTLMACGVIIKRTSKLVSVKRSTYKHKYKRVKGTYFVHAERLALLCFGYSEFFGIL